ncbi:hypothetical protein M3Y99_00316200 [Aphelenchoides fujianensis]|nr:hypothetical protein M3Y99_00316200 [Aphelenchoides fujianensis]
MNAAAAGAAGGKAAPGGAVAVQPAAPPINQMAMFGSVPKSDDYIMNELKAYSKKNGGISSVPETIFNYNRKYTEMLKERAAAAARNPRQIDADKLKLYKEFEYNRRYGNIV